MGLKKLFKKARKALGIPALTLGNAAKLGAAAATGGLGAGALALGTGVLKSKLKSAAVSGVKQIVKTKAAKAQLRKAAVLQTPGIVAASARKPAAIARPGGAPLKAASLTARARVKPIKAKKTAKVKKASGAKRAPPKGGKDLKALSASWKAAGKPGKWLDWVKSH